MLIDWLAMACQGLLLRGPARSAQGGEMSAVHDLSLTHLPISSPALAADPTPHFERGRMRHPWLMTSDSGFVVTEYAAMKDLLRMDDHMQVSGREFVERMGAHGTGWGRFAEEMLVVKSGADHARIRGSVAAAFTPRSINRLRPVMREVVSDLLVEWLPRGGFDFADFAAQFPIRVMFGLIGADVALLPDILSSLETHGSSFSLDASRMPVVEAAYQVLWRFVDTLIRERGRAAPRGDLLDDLIAANTAGGLGDEELRLLLIFLFAAGYDTSKNLLTLAMHSLLDDPSAWKRCALEPAFCEKVVNEQLRLASPSNVYRQVTRAFEYRDVFFPEHTLLILPLGVSGRDPAVFEYPLDFRPDRAQPEPHLAFGRGAHICLGQFLARAQAEEALHLMAQRIVEPRLAGEVAWRPFPGVWGIRSLPIAFAASAPI
jgi:cytochrome P450